MDYLAATTVSLPKLDISVGLAFVIALIILGAYLTKRAGMHFTAFIAPFLLGIMSVAIWPQYSGKIALWTASNAAAKTSVIFALLAIVVGTIIFTERSNR